MVQEKTNVMRFLEKKKIPYTPFFFDPKEALDGKSVASFLNEDPKRVFKTLVTLSKNNTPYVFMIPVEEELDLKKAAKAVNEKAVSILKQKDLLQIGRSHA